MRTRVAIISFVVLVCACVPSFAQQSIDDQGIEGTPGFVWRPNIMGTIVRASNPSEIGKKVTFVGLNSSAPKVVFESGVTSPLQRLYEDEQTITLVLVATGSGSLDGFVIDKKTGKFARATAGSFIGVYASASIGRVQ